MSGILEDFYFGKIVPCELPFSHSKESSTLDQKIKEEEDYFAGFLSQEDWHRFVKLTDLHIDSACANDADIFSCGFRLGALMMLEVVCPSS